MELNDLLTNLILDFGYSDLSFDIDAIGFMDGFAVDKQSSFLKLVDPLSSLYSFNIAFTSGRIRLTHRLNKPILTITPDECIIDKSVDAIALEIVDSLSLPKTLTLNLTDSTYDFRQMSVLAQVPVVVSKHESVADIAVLTFRSYAKQLAEIWLNDLWTGRSYFKFNLSKKYLSLEVGDNIILERNDMSHLIMITNIVDTHYRSIEARSLSPDIYNYRESDISVPVVSSPKLPGPGHFVVLDLALARQSPLCLQYLAVYADPWPTSFALYLQNGQSFTFNQTISKPSNIGTTQNIFTSGPTDIFDMHSVLIVTCPFALSSVSILDVFNGKNYAAVLGDDQQWEIIAFCQATLIAPSTYKLSQFLRGLGGQDYLAQRTVQSGATFVLLDDTIISLASGTSMLGITQTWRLGPSSRNYGDDTYLEFEATPTSLALKPYPPRHLSALKNNNDIIINFMRSGRIDADGWEPIDIPLGEDSLLFELDVMRDGKVVRTLTSSSQQIIYASFDQISDFGSLVSSLSIQIYQISSIVGRGFPATGQFNFT